MANTPKLLASPAYIGAAAANIYTPAGGSALIRDIVRHIHVTNDTASPATFSLFIGATGGSAAGTEVVNTQTVAANSTWDWYGMMVLISTTFLTGICQTGASKLTIMAEGEQQVI
jgi:hypothetical protein